MSGPAWDELVIKQVGLAFIEQLKNSCQHGFKCYEFYCSFHLHWLQKNSVAFPWASTQKDPLFFRARSRPRLWLLLPAAPYAWWGCLPCCLGSWELFPPISVFSLPNSLLLHGLGLSPVTAEGFLSCLPAPPWCLFVGSLGGSTVQQNTEAC